MTYGRFKKRHSKYKSQELLRFRGFQRTYEEKKIENSIEKNNIFFRKIKQFVGYLLRCRAAIRTAWITYWTVSYFKISRKSKFKIARRAAGAIMNGTLEWSR